MGRGVFATLESQMSIGVAEVTTSNSSLLTPNYLLLALACTFCYKYRHAWRTRARHEGLPERNEDEESSIEDEESPDA